MTWRDVNSCYCDWWVPSGIWDRWWWCDVKMVERRCWRTREIECTLPCAIVTTYVVCDKRWYSYGMSLRYFMFFLAVVRFPYDMACLLVLVPIAVVSQYSGVMGWWRGGDAKACMREWGRGKVVWFVCHQHAWHQFDTYVWGWRNVTWTCSCDSRRFTRGFGLVAWCM